MYEDVRRGCQRMLIFSYTIWFPRDQRARAPRWAPTVDKRCSTVLRGVSHEGRLIGGGARNQEPDGDIRHRDIDLDRFGPSDRRNTLCPVSLLDCIEYELNSMGFPTHLI